MHPDSNNRTCPICSRSLGDLLRHLRIQHNIENIEQLTRQISWVEKKNKRREKFAEFVDMLKKKIQNKEITYEDYRRLVTQWTGGE